MDSQTTFLSLQDISKRYDDTVALDRVSLDINKGEVFGYIGPNGAGKTTTIKILVGLIQDFGGRYRLNGNPVSGTYAEVQKIMGYLPQGVSFQEWCTVDTALRTLGELSGIPRDSLDHKIEELLRLLDLSDVRYRKVSKLSGGMVQKVGLAQALLNDPQFLVLDEPLNGLDPTSRNEVKKVIKDPSAKGTTVFFSSHILSDVEDIADRIAILDKGHILKLGSTSQLTEGLSPYCMIEISFFRDCDVLDLLGSVHHIEEVTQQSRRQIIIRLPDDADVEMVSHEILCLLISNNCHIQTFRRITQILMTFTYNISKADRTMSLPLLYRDELSGFYKSNVMIILWIGLPLLGITAYISLPNLDKQTPMSLITSSIISSVGGWLAAIMLAVHIIHEKSHHVYDLFLIRPVHRSHIVLSKFLAVFTCVVSATIISMILSLIVDYFFLQQHSETLFTDTLESLIPSLSIIAMECAAGAFVGVLVSSVLVGIILIVITHNISSLAILLPIMSHYQHTTLLSVAIGVVLTSVFLYLAVALFQRRQF